MQKAISFNNVTIISVKCNGYRIYFWYMDKDDAISIMRNSNLMDKKAHYNFCIYTFFTYRYNWNNLL